MRFITIILSGIAILIVLLLIVALFVKKDYSIHREIVINKPKKDVFDYVKYLKNQENYNKWVMADPNMKKDLKGIDGTVGFIYGWNGNDQVGEGEQQITNITEAEKLESQIHFIRPFEGLAQIEMTTKSSSGGQTKVGWTMSGTSKYPMNLTNLFVNGMLGKDMETSLKSLKAILEK
ncbi:SRPBCC family protein [Dyadobacter psychrotolerans]|uniref:Polyketide cyclase n=1 Tax=Dyadobacter psychrotolerans TaxID=2541721 RepID=A0A4R5DKN2_9BACT|nr:SRPBCC family protein [Dyadobacter psychrotolerans]TDE14609.1 polyketide cyclase [Dyadobacter psychrotolerans]